MIEHSTTRENQLDVPDCRCKVALLFSIISRINLSPFTKDFRGGEHLISMQDLFLEAWSYDWATCEMNRNSFQAVLLHSSRRWCNRFKWCFQCNFNTRPYVHKLMQHLLYYPECVNVAGSILILSSPSNIVIVSNFPQAGAPQKNTWNSHSTRVWFFIIEFLSKNNNPKALFFVRLLIYIFNRRIRIEKKSRNFYAFPSKKMFLCKVKERQSELSLLHVDTSKLLIMN